MSAAEFLYDVAFSFLGEDEGTARRISDAVQGRVTTFMYSDPERQTFLAGRDGGERFAKVYGVEARTVVVLYRTGWGERGFTSAEANGIRNRAFEHGFDFTTFIPLDNPPTVPPWLPRNRLWLGLEQYGVQGAAAVIESRVQEAGGTPRREDAETVALAARRQLDAEAHRDAFLESAEGAAALVPEFWRIFAELERVTKLTPGVIEVPTRPADGSPRFAAATGARRVMFALDRRYSNTTLGSKLHVTEWGGEWWGWGAPEVGRHEHRYSFAPDMDAAGTLGWRLVGGDDAGFYTTADLAKWALKRIIARTTMQRAADRARREQS